MTDQLRIDDDLEQADWVKQSFDLLPFTDLFNDHLPFEHPRWAEAAKSVGMDLEAFISLPAVQLRLAQGFEWPLDDVEDDLDEVEEEEE